MSDLEELYHHILRAANVDLPLLQQLLHCIMDERDWGILKTFESTPLNSSSPAGPNAEIPATSPALQRRVECLALLLPLLLMDNCPCLLHATPVGTNVNSYQHPRGRPHVL